MVFRLIAIRIGTALATLIAVSIVIFVGMELLPGNAATSSLGQEASNPQKVRQFERAFGLDEPLTTRYADWVTGLAGGDLGKSLPSGRPVSEIVSHRLRNTAVLALATLILLVPIALGLGILAAMRHDRLVDHGIAVTTLGLISTPEFVIGAIVATVLSVWLGLFPAVSLIDPREPVLSQLDLVVLPVITLVLAYVAQTARLIRATTMDVIRSEFVQAAVLRGTPTRILLRRHIVPNAITPAIQVIAMTCAFFFGGVVVTEAVFSYPGIGVALKDAVSNRDVATVEAIGMIMSGVYILSLLAADVLAIVLNPRLRRS